MTTPTKLASVVLAGIFALGLSACYALDGKPAAPATTATAATSAAVTPEPVAAAPEPTSTAARHERSVAWGTDEQIAVQTEFCGWIDAAWDAYFGHDDSDAAVTILRYAAKMEPASFGPFDSANGAARYRLIDRDVRFIDGGPDSQYIEITTGACWDWADAIGVDLGDRAVGPIRLP